MARYASTARSGTRPSGSANHRQARIRCWIPELDSFVTVIAKQNQVIETPYCGLTRLAKGVNTVFGEYVQLQGNMYLNSINPYTLSFYSGW